MPHSSIPDLTDPERAYFSALSRLELEDLAWQFHELAHSLSDRLGEVSTTSSPPPSGE
jgi:hypothetical protein